MGDQVSAKEMIMIWWILFIFVIFSNFVIFQLNLEGDSRRMTLQTKPVLTTCCITQPRTALFATYLSEIYSDWPLPYSKHCPIIRMWRLQLVLALTGGWRHTENLLWSHVTVSRGPSLKLAIMISFPVGSSSNYVECCNPPLLPFTNFPLLLLVLKTDW